MTSLVAVIATIGTMAGAVSVDTTDGSSTQQEIKHIFDYANRLSTHDDDNLPSGVLPTYLLWPSVTPGIETTTNIKHVSNVEVTGGDFIADTTGIRQIVERGDDLVWRSFQANRDMTLEAINEALFDDYRGLEAMTTDGFIEITDMREQDPAPAMVDDNDGIVGDAIDLVINKANTANWNAIRANGMSAAGLALANDTIINDIINEKVAINRVLNEYDEAAARIMDGLL